MLPDTHAMIVKARVNSLGQVPRAPHSLCLDRFLIQCFLYHIRAVCVVFVVDCKIFFHFVVDAKNSHKFLPAPYPQLLQCYFCSSCYQWLESSISPETGMASWLVLANGRVASMMQARAWKILMHRRSLSRLSQQPCHHGNKTQLICWRTSRYLEENWDTLDNNQQGG